MRRAARGALGFAAALLALTLVLALAAHYARAEADSYVAVPAELLSRAADLIEAQRAEIARLRTACKLEPT